VVKKNH